MLPPASAPYRYMRNRFLQLIMGKGSVRSYFGKAKDAERRSLLTDKDRMLDRRDPWPGFKTEMEFEVDRNKRMYLSAIGVIIMTLILHRAYMNHELVQHNCDNFELLRKRLAVGGSFPPDFETEEEKAQWQK